MLITAKILNELGIELSFADFPALTASLKGLLAEDVSALCALEQAPEKIVKAIATVENLVMLASVELNDKLLSALLQGKG